MFDQYISLHLLQKNNLSSSENIKRWRKASTCLGILPPVINSHPYWAFKFHFPFEFLGILLSIGASNSPFFPLIESVSPLGLSPHGLSPPLGGLRAIIAKIIKICPVLWTAKPISEAHSPAQCQRYHWQALHFSLSGTVQLSGKTRSGKVLSLQKNRCCSSNLSSAKTKEMH